MDLHDKKQPYDEHDDLEEELLEEGTDDIPVLRGISRR